MKLIIVWTLIVLGPQPYSLGRYPTNQQCTQEKYNYGSSLSSNKKEKKPTLVCRSSYRYVPVNKED